MAPELSTNRDQVRERVLEFRRDGATVGLVPTMGALHQGHLSLVEASTGQCQCTIVTIFVNPAQFGPDEDLECYPRDLEADLKLLAPYGVDLVFAPPVQELYRPGHSTYIEPPVVAKPLEGEFRPHHFRGVATILLKLFQLVPADVAFFGQKDYQQSLLVRRMVDELDVPITIEVCPIVRESDGLALSSRNAYLGAEERKQALAISRCLRQAVALFHSGETGAAIIQSAMRDVLHCAGVTQVDYVALANPETLADVTTVDENTMALVAAHVGTTRLIDNTRLG